MRIFVMAVCALLNAASEHVQLTSPEVKVREAMLVYKATVQSTLPVESVQIGVLYAATPERLSTPEQLYAIPAPKDIGVVVRDVPLLGKNVHFTAPATVEARHYATHLLSYRLQALTPDTLTQLLTSLRPVDEHALVTMLGIGTDATDKEQVTGRYAAAVQNTLIDWALAPIPANPTLSHLRERVLAVAALGAMGGGDARDVLQAVGAMDFAPLDHVWVLQPTGNAWTTPLLHAVNAKSMKELVAAARTQADKPAPTPKAAAVAKPKSDLLIPTLIGIIIALTLALIGTHWYYRRHADE